MKTLLLAAAMAVSLAGGSAMAGPTVAGIPPVGHGGVHGIIIHRCHPGHWNRFCRCRPSRWNHWCHRPLGIIIGHPIGRVVGHTVGLNTGVHGLVIHHPIGVPAHNTATLPARGVLVNGVPAEQRVQH